MKTAIRFLPVPILGLLVQAAQANLIRVPFDYRTISQACEFAQSGDTVGVYPGEYGDESAAVRPGVSVIGMGTDSSLVTVYPSGFRQTFDVLPGADPALIENISIQAGYAAIVINNPSVRVRRCRLFTDEAGQYLVAAGSGFLIEHCRLEYTSQREGPCFELVGEGQQYLIEDCVVGGYRLELSYIGQHSRLELRNDTIIFGVASYVGCQGAPWPMDFSFEFVDCIFDDRPSCRPILPDTLEWRYNDFATGPLPACGALEGNLCVDPLFCDDGYPPDVRLQPDSPCRGAGENGEDMGARLGICWEQFPQGVGRDASQEALVLSGPIPNPTRDRVSLTMDGGVDELVRMDVLDISGRLLATVRFTPTRVGSAAALTWDTRESAGHQVAPGLYQLRVSTGKQTVSRRVLVIR